MMITTLCFVVLTSTLRLLPAFNSLQYPSQPTFRHPTRLSVTTNNNVPQTASSLIICLDTLSTDMCAVVTKINGKLPPLPPPLPSPSKLSEVTRSNLSLLCTHLDRLSIIESTHAADMTAVSQSGGFASKSLSSKYAKAQMLKSCVESWVAFVEDCDIAIEMR